LEEPNKWSSWFHDFLAQCFQQNPQRRSSATELLQHPFIQRAAQKKQMEELLKMAFVLRITEGLEC
jgi:serine/threonine protein kinase